MRSVQPKWLWFVLDLGFPIFQAMIRISKMYSIILFSSSHVFYFHGNYPRLCTALRHDYKK